jgi:hypothetical protein
MTIQTIIDRMTEVLHAQHAVESELHATACAEAGREACLRLRFEVASMTAMQLKLR